MSDPREQVTQILRDFERREHAAEDLLPLVYDQLHHIARNRMSGERADHTLQATALVNEVYLKLVGDNSPGYENRKHFYAVAAEAMRRILIDHARKKKADKRGGGKKGVPLSVVDLADDHDPDQILALEEAMRALEQEDARAARVVELRFFGGLSVEQTAEILDISERTVMREWSYARAKLFHHLAGEQDPDPS